MNFTYSRRSEAIYAQGRDALLQARGEKEKLAAQLHELAAQLHELRAQSELSTRMMDHATRSLVKSREQRKSFMEETSKLREELENEKKSHAELRSGWIWSLLKRRLSSQRRGRPDREAPRSQRERSLG